MGLLYTYGRAGRVTAGMQVNPRHPLARGLWAALVCGGVNGPFINLAPRAPHWTKGNATLTYSHAPRGLAVRKANGFTQIATLAGPTPANPSGGLTASGVVIISDHSTASLTGIVRAGSNGFGLTAAGNLALFVNSAQRVVGATTTLSLSQEEETVGFSCAPSVYRVFYQGALDGSSTPAFNGFGWPETLGTFGSYGGPVRISLALLWAGRLLSDDEHATIARDPFDLFEIARPLLTVSGGAAAAGTGVAQAGPATTASASKTASASAAARAAPAATASTSATRSATGSASGASQASATATATHRASASAQAGPGASGSAQKSASTSATSGAGSAASASATASVAGSTSGTAQAGGNATVTATATRGTSASAGGLAGAAVTATKAAPALVLVHSAHSASASAARSARATATAQAGGIALASANTTAPHDPVPAQDPIGAASRRDPATRIGQTASDPARAIGAASVRAPTRRIG